MKKLSIIFTLLLGYIITINAQISIRTEIPSQPTISKIAPYDSLANFDIDYDIVTKKYSSIDDANVHLKQQFEKYKGQDLYILPPTQRNAQLNFGNKIDKLRGKYYNITDINFEIRERYDGTYEIENLIFQLKDSKGKKAKWETPYYSLDESLLVGYYEKLKKNCVNHKFIYTGRAKGKGSLFIKEPKIDHTAIDTKTKEVIKLHSGQEWHCSDVQLVDDEYSMELYAVLNNNEGAEIIARLKNRFKFNGEMNVAFFSCFMIENEYTNWKNQIIEKYGEKYGNMILLRKVQIGMTKEMCSESWGNPYDINTTSVNGKTSEQWVYENDSYLYFDNGILTAVQN